MTVKQKPDSNTLWVRVGIVKASSLKTILEGTEEPDRASAIRRQSSKRLWTDEPLFEPGNKFKHIGW